MAFCCWDFFSFVFLILEQIYQNCTLEVVIFCCRALNDDITSVSQCPVKTSDIPRRWMRCLSAKQCELFAKHNSGKVNSNHSTGNETVHEINDYRISPTCLIAAATPPHSNPQPHRLSLILCYSVCVLRLQLYTYVNHRNVCSGGAVEVWGQIEPKKSG
jgi:hypothetical protein